MGPIAIGPVEPAVGRRAIARALASLYYGPLGRAIGLWRSGETRPSPPPQGAIVVEGVGQTRDRGPRTDGIDRRQTPPALRQIFSRRPLTARSQTVTMNTESKSFISLERRKQRIIA